MSSYIFIDALIKKDDNNINSSAVNMYNKLLRKNFNGNFHNLFDSFEMLHKR